MHEATTRRWRLIRSGACDPAFNMALDEAILRAEPVVPTFRTYSFSPYTLSLGYFQPFSRRLLDSFGSRGIPVVRRPTGGRAIYHADELTYSFVCPLGEPGLRSDTIGAYEDLHGALGSALAKLGVAATMRGDRRLESDSGEEDELYCFYRSSPFDLVANRRKLVGSAQRRTGRGFLQHGSIPAGANSVTPRAAHVGRSREAIGRAFAAQIESTFRVRLVPGDPTERELEMARDLVARRYGTREWTLRRRRTAGDRQPTVGGAG